MLPGGMLVVDSGIAMAAHSISSVVVVVATSKHSASASGIAVGETDTEGAASAMAPTAG
jgi:hypothetical protein